MGQFLLFLKWVTSCNSTIWWVILSLLLYRATVIVSQVFRLRLSFSFMDIFIYYSDKLYCLSHCHFIRALIVNRATFPYFIFLYEILIIPDMLFFQINFKLIFTIFTRNLRSWLNELINQVGKNWYLY